MKTRRILSLALTLAMVASLITLPVPSASAAPVWPTAAWLLKVDPSDGIYSIGDQILRNSSNGGVAWSTGAGGWYYPVAPGSASDGYRVDVKQSTYPGNTVGDKMIEFSANASALPTSTNSWRRVHLDLTSPISRNTGVYGMTFEYSAVINGTSGAASGTSSGPIQFGFSDTVFGTATSTTGVGVNINTGHMRIMPTSLQCLTSGTTTYSDVLTGMDTTTAGTLWYRVHAVINTDTDKVTWYVEPVAGTTTFDDVAKNLAGGTEGLLTWGPDDRIYSLSFSNNAAGDMVRLNNLEVFEYDNPGDDDFIAIAKSAIETAFLSKTAPQASVGNATEAETFVDDAIDALKLKIDTAEVKNATFTAATAGVAGDKKGTDGSFKFKVEIKYGTGTPVTTVELTMPIKATYYIDPNSRLSVDFGDGTYPAAGSYVLGLGTNNAAWYKNMATGWWSFNGIGSAAFARMDANEAHPAILGPDVLALTCGNGTIRSIHIDLYDAIEPGTGVYGMTFYYSVALSGNNRMAMWLSDAKSGAASGATGTADKIREENASGGQEHLIFTDNGVQALTAKPNTYGEVRADAKGGVWYKVHAVIDTDNSAITWYVGDITSTVEFEDILDGSVTDNVGEGLLTWGAGKKINSIGFYSGNTTNTILSLGGLEVFDVDTHAYVPLTGMNPLNPSTKTIEANQSFTIDTPEVIPANGVQNVVWTTDAPFVATVENGVVTGQKAGTANITATSLVDSSLTQTCVVTVIPTSTTVLAEWRFTSENYPDATGASALATTANPQGVKKLDASGGEAMAGASLVRSHDKGYPKGNNVSGPLDNTNTIKHMALESPTGFWLQTYGWSTPENYVYLEVSTKGYTNLALSYDLRASSSSTPASLKLQYSLDNKTWINVPGGDIETRYPSAGATVERVEYLPVATYDQDKVYLRWTGTSSSTSGRIEFRKIILYEDENADPGDPEETIFTHINIAPGSDPSQLGFAWFTPQAHTPKMARLQLVEASKLTRDGRFPISGYKTYIGVSATGTDGIGNVSDVYNTNKVTVTGLAKNTKYAYRVGDGTNWSNVYTFNTQNPDGAFEVLLVADPQVSSSPFDWWRVAEVMTQTAPNAAFIMSAGDQTNDSNNLLQVEGYVGAPQLRSYPVMATVGNHDNQMSDTYPHVAHLSMMYQWPNDKMKSAAQAGGWDYYFKYGNALFISLNSNNRTALNHEALIKEAIAFYPDATWRIALFHHDIYGGGDHAGSGYGDSASMQATWSPFLDKYDIDVVFNGHDHIYARSKFVKNDTIQKNQMAAILDNPVTQANPGVFVLPNGIQYFGLSAAGDKSYELEMQEWIAFSPGNLNTPEYSVMLVDGDNIVIDTYHIKSSVPYDTITLRKKALKSDLSSLIAGAKALPKNDILAAGWDAFQAEIPKAEAALSGSADQVHNAYVALYEKFFALSTPIDKTELGLLIKEVKATLSKASEGMYEGSYPKGSKKVLQGVLDTAAEQYETRLPVVADYNAAVTALKTQYAAFLASVSTVPITWVVLHDIEATGVNTVDLIGWMNETVTYDWKDSAERYDSNLTKPNVAITGANVSQSKVAGNSDGPRAEPFFGPANKEGGRGDSDGHITDTFVGEWVRYELDVAQAGSYEVKLGAVNTTASAQTILLRDTEQNILATFTVPSGGSLPASWSAAPMIAADKEVYLPAGRYVVELFFKNNGARPSNNTNYAAGTGADIDILTFERKGAGTPPDDVTDLYIHNLPLPAPMAAGAPARQRGWGNSTDEFGHTGGATAAQLKAATHLVLELATNDCPSGSFQIQIVTDYDGYNWNQTEIRESLSQYWDDTAKTLTIPFAELTGYDALRGITDRGWICVSFYSQGWNELCVMKAWLVLDKSYVPETEKPDVNMLNLTLDDLGGQFYAAGNEETEYDWTMLDRNNGLDDGENYLRVASLDTDTLQTASGNEDFTYENIRYFGFQLHIRDTAQSKFLSEGDKATVLIEYKLYKDGALLEQDERSITISYHPDAALSYQIWDNDDFIFPANYREEGSEYEFYYEVKKITSIKVAGSNGGGSGGSGDSSGATVTEPTHKEEIKLSEKTIAKAADAIEEAMEETLEAVAEALEAETGETVVSNVVLDLGVKLPAGVDEVVFTVPAAIAEAIGDAVKAIEEAIEEGADIDFSVTFPLGLAEVSLDLEALASVFGGGEEVSFNIVLVAEDAREDADIDEALADVVGDRPVYSLYITVGGQPVTSFGGGLVTVAIPYTLGKGEDPNAILVWYINKDGELDVMRSYYEDGYVIFTTDHFSSFVIGYNPVTFGDNLEITAGMRPHVTFVASRGLYKGNQRLDGTRFFNPKGNLTYQELAAVLANYQGIGGTLKNYPADHIAWGAAFGIFGDKTFVHAEEVTRADMAYIICNYIKASGLKVDKIRSFTFSDLGGVDKERSNAILALASYGVISGDAGDGGTFRPDAGITREEVAAILAQLVKAFKK